MNRKKGIAVVGGIGLLALNGFLLWEIGQLKEAVNNQAMWIRSEVSNVTREVQGITSRIEETLTKQQSKIAAYDTVFGDWEEATPLMVPIQLKVLLKENVVGQQVSFFVEDRVYEADLAKGWYSALGEVPIMGTSEVYLVTQVNDTTYTEKITQYDSLYRDYIQLFYGSYMGSSSYTGGHVAYKGTVEIMATEDSQQLEEVTMNIWVDGVSVKEEVIGTNGYGFSWPVVEQIKINPGEQLYLTTTAKGKNGLKYTMLLDACGISEAGEPIYDADIYYFVNQIVQVKKENGTAIYTAKKGDF